MKVWYACMLQAAGYQAICGSEERAKEWIKEAIIQHQGPNDDPDHQWDGWVWYRDEMGNLCFGDKISAEAQESHGEGFVKEFEVLI